MITIQDIMKKCGIRVNKEYIPLHQAVRRLNTIDTLEEITQDTIKECALIKKYEVNKEGLRLRAKPSLDDYTLKFVNEYIRLRPNLNKLKKAYGVI